MAGEALKRGSTTAVFAAMCILLVVLTAADFAIDRALDSQLLSVLQSEREHVVRLTQLRKAARRSYVEVLERRLAPSANPPADEVAALDAASARLASMAWTADQREIVSRLTAVAAAFAERCRTETARPGTGVPAGLAEALAEIDTLANRLLARESLDEFKVAESVDSGLVRLERARLFEQVGLSLAVLLTMAFGLRWTARTERLRVEKAAADRSRSDMERMAGVLAHEVNGQLAVLQNVVSILERDRPGSDALRYQQESIDHMRELVADFRLFGGSERLAMTDVDAVAAARQAVAAMGAAVEVSVPERLMVRADGHALQRALMNLLRNAQEARGPVRLRIEATGRMARFTVEDEGPGLSPEAAERVGEPFFTTKLRGTGLGVAIVTGVARWHGGTFVLRNRAGGPGAEAVLEIPL